MLEQAVRGGAVAITTSRDARKAAPISYGRVPGLLVKGRTPQTLGESATPTSTWRLLGAHADREGEERHGRPALRGHSQRELGRAAVTAARGGMAVNRVKRLRQASRSAGR